MRRLLFWSAIEFLAVLVFAAMVTAQSGVQTWQSTQGSPWQGTQAPIDRSKEIPPTITTRPAVEHFYSCPDGYELKYFVPATPTFIATEAIGIYAPPSDNYYTAPTQDILRADQPVCAPKPPPVAIKTPARDPAQPLTNGTTSAGILPLSSGAVSIIGTVNGATIGPMEGLLPLNIRKNVASCNQHEQWRYPNPECMGYAIEMAKQYLEDHPELFALKPEDEPKKAPAPPKVHKHPVQPKEGSDAH